MLKKIAQIKEYYRLKKNTKLKESEFYEACLDECAAWGKIHKRMQSVEDIVVHRINEGLFGSINYPCIVEKIAQIPINDITRFYHNPDKTFYCPKYDKTEEHPCKNTKCVHYQANHEWFTAVEKRNKIWNELKNIILDRDTAKNRIFDRTK